MTLRKGSHPFINYLIIFIFCISLSNSVIYPTEIISTIPSGILIAVENRLMKVSSQGELLWEFIPTNSSFGFIITPPIYQQELKMIYVVYDLEPGDYCLVGISEDGEGLWESTMQGSSVDSVTISEDKQKIYITMVTIEPSKIDEHTAFIKHQLVSYSINGTYEWTLTLSKYPAPITHDNVREIGGSSSILLSFRMIDFISLFICISISFIL